MTTVSRKQAALLWALRPGPAGRRRHSRTELSFRKDAQAYLWRTGRFSKISGN
jgi:hypothetical protein